MSGELDKLKDNIVSTVYDADYFIHGKQSGKSLYENYRWIPDLTLPMVRTMVQYLGIKRTNSILDFGCARGYIVRALCEMKYDAWGYDISKWAIENCDETIRRRVSSSIMGYHDWFIAKDVLEHIPQVADTITHLMSLAYIGVFAVVPLSPADGEPYVVPEYEKDVTHIHRLTLASWVRLFTRPGWEIIVSYCVPGIKDNYAEWKTGNGFITARRIVT